VARELANSLLVHGWILCQSGNKGMACVVKAEIDTGPRTRSLIGAFIAVVAHRAIKVNGPEVRPDL
jgi:hypothetical protein